MFVYELSGCGFESRGCLLDACFGGSLLSRVFSSSSWSDPAKTHHRCGYSNLKSILIEFEGFF